MVITGIFHAAIKTNDLAATLRFYTQVRGLREAPRPDMSPGRRYEAGSSFFVPAPPASARA